MMMMMTYDGFSDENHDECMQKCSFLANKNEISDMVGVQMNANGVFHFSTMEKILIGR